VEIVTAVNPRLKEEDMVDSLCMVACDEPSKVIAYPAVPEVTALWIEAVEEEEVEEVEEVEVDRRRRRRLTHMICNFCLIKLQRCVGEISTSEKGN
tara:strand:- start:72 stop:359 length:288 start_codon:yes stop_codon:yes gene_type:complete